MSALHFASQNNRVELLNLLIRQEDIDINCQEKVWTDEMLQKCASLAQTYFPYKK
jgi:hypothetical protein